MCCDFISFILVTCRLTDSVVLEEGGRSGATVGPQRSPKSWRSLRPSVWTLFMSPPLGTPAGVLSKWGIHTKHLPHTRQYSVKGMHYNIAVLRNKVCNRISYFFWKVMHCVTFCHLGSVLRTLHPGYLSNHPECPSKPPSSAVKTTQANLATECRVLPQQAPLTFSSGNLHI